MERRVSFPAVAALGMLLLAASPARADGDRSGRHPHFDDQGTLTWHTRLSDALAAARAEGKVVLVDYGRLRCTQCRILVTKVFPDTKVRARLGKVAVGLAVDCDNPEACVDALLRKQLGETGILPYVGFLAADGRWIAGFSGSRSVAEFLGDLAVVERALPARLAAEPAKVAAKAQTVPASDLRLSVGARDAAPTGVSPAPVLPPAPVPTVAKVRTAPAAGRVPPPVVDPLVRRTQALDAAGRGAWGEVVRHCRHGSAKDPVLVDLRAKAHAWAEERLAFATTAGRDRRFDEAVFAASRVKDALRGEPEAEDAARGLEALHLAKELARLSPRSAEALALRQSAEARVRGTRWVALLS